MCRYILISGTQFSDERANGVELKKIQFKIVFLCGR